MAWRGATQRTLARAVSFSGVALHCGKQSLAVVHPAPNDSGIVFRCSTSGFSIPATWEHVVPSALCTTLARGEMSVATVEHLMAGIYACGIHNATIEVKMTRSATAGGSSGSACPATVAAHAKHLELPILDGSAAPFVHELMRAGLTLQSAPLSYYEVLRPVRVVTTSGASASLCPLPPSPPPRTTTAVPPAAAAAVVPTRAAYPAPTLELSVETDFSSRRAALGRRVCTATLGPSVPSTVFALDVAPARTFAFAEDIDALRSRGLALGGSLENAVVFGAANGAAAVNTPDAVVERKPGVIVLNEEGLRYADEWSRHKLLDSIGDLALAGAPIHGLFHGVRGGHASHHALLVELFRCDDDNGGAVRRVVASATDI